MSTQPPDGGAVVIDPATYGVIAPIDLYLRCPHCDRVAQPDSLDYASADGEGHTIDERRHVEGRCPVCHQLFDARGHWVAAQDQITCSRCGAHSPAAAEAVRARCFECNLFNFGPGLKTQEEREAFAAVEALERRRMLYRRMPWRFPRPPDGVPGIEPGVWQQDGTAGGGSGGLKASPPPAEASGRSTGAPPWGSPDPSSGDPR